jgi:CubicO group peptidase (beta-lactamase class C family)
MKILIKILPVCFTFFLASCLNDVPMKVNTSYVPEHRNDGIEISTPEKEGLSSSGISAVYERFFSEDEYQTARSLLIFRHGKLVSEGYCIDKVDIDKKYHIQSVTKSVLSLLVGIASGKGYFPSPGARMSSVLTEFSNVSFKKDITFYDLLTMQSGIDFDDENDDDLYFSSSQIEYIKNLPVRFSPGTKFHYQGCDPILTKFAMERLTKMTIKDFADKYLFSKLNINDYTWDICKDGTYTGANGLYMRARDMGKIGLLCLQKGMWNGEQIVPADWINEMSAIRTTQDVGSYGYYWWIRPDLKAYSAWGHGGQFIYILPQEDIVIVFTSYPNTSGDFQITLTQFEYLVYDVVNSVLN